MSHEPLDSKEISVRVGDGTDDSTRAMLLFTGYKELTDCRWVLGADSSAREKEH